MNQERAHWRPNCINRKNLTKRFDLLAILASIPLVYLVARIGILEPTCGAFGVFDHGLILILLAGIIIVAGVYGFRSKSTRWTILAIVALDIVACISLSSSSSNAYAWKSYLQNHKAELTEAVGMANAHAAFPIGDKGPRLVNLPHALKHLSKQGKLEVFTDPDGEVWYVFPMSTVDIDNTVGLAWNAKGKRPPNKAYPNVANSRSLGSGWYQFQST